MSDTQENPDWWQASDGKWYPPQDATPPPAATPPPPGAMGTPPPPEGMDTTSSFGTPPPPGMGTPPPMGSPPPMGGGIPQYGQPAQTNSNATISIILGVLSIFLCGIFTGVPAIILGLKSRKEIAASDGRQTGDGIALGGVITGAIGTVISTGIFIMIVALAVWADDTVDDFDGINSDPSNGVCNEDRFLQDPDC
jgi:hypothetical protein